eukprot:4350882-Amphidinium_carterae.1
MHVICFVVVAEQIICAGMANLSSKTFHWRVAVGLLTVRQAQQSLPYGKAWNYSSYQEVLELRATDARDGALNRIFSPQPSILFWNKS